MLYPLSLAFSFLSSHIPVHGINKINFISDVTIDKKSKPLIKKIQRIIVAVPLHKGDSVYPVRDYLTYAGLVSYEAGQRFALTVFINALHQLKKKKEKARIAASFLLFIFICLQVKTAEQVLQV